MIMNSFICNIWNEFSNKFNKKNVERRLKK